MGQIYVPVNANVADGINTLDTSGIGGIEGGGYWITWNTSGYSGIGWFWNDSYNYLQKGWEAAVDKYNGFIDNCNGVNGAPHTKEEASFLLHVQNGHGENLDTVLGNWSADDKLAFLKAHTDVFINCTE